jgi:hypothetical protein
MSNFFTQQQYPAGTVHSRNASSGGFSNHTPTSATGSEDIEPMRPLETLYHHRDDSHNQLALPDGGSSITKNCCMPKTQLRGAVSRPPSSSAAVSGGMTLDLARHTATHRCPRFGPPSPLVMGSFPYDSNPPRNAGGALLSGASWLESSIGQSHLSGRSFQDEYLKNAAGMSTADVNHPLSKRGMTCGGRGDLGLGSSAIAGTCT